MVGAKAKDSSLEIGAIVQGRAGLRNGGTGMSEHDFGDVAINPRENQSSPGALAVPVVVCDVVGVLEVFAEA